MTKVSKPKIEDAAIVHKKCVFADKEFTKPAKAIAKNLGVSGDNPIERIKLGDRYYCLLGVNAETVVPKAIVVEMETLAAEFLVGIKDVIDFLNNSHKSSIYEYISPRVEVKFWPPDGITINVPPEATKQDIINQLDKVERLQKLFTGKRGATRRRAPKNYKLIYAIFRVRAKGYTFNKIFLDYKAKTLPLYHGQATSYQSEDSLERYYRKYKPEGSI